MKKQYSLIEIMVAMGVFALMMTLLMNFFGQATDVMTRETNRAEKLYEAGVFSVVMNKDFSKIRVDGTYPLSYEVVSGKTVLRFFSETYDSNGEIGDLLGVSYVYDPSEYSISRYVYTTVDPGDGKYFGGDITTFAGLEADDTKGSVIIEGIENVLGASTGVGGYQLLIYEDYNLMVDADGSDETNVVAFEGAEVSKPVFDSSNLITTPPDVLSIRIVMNDLTTLKSGTTEENLLVQTRRIFSDRVMVAYKK